MLCSRPSTPLSSRSRAVWTRTSRRRSPSGRRVERSRSSTTSMSRRSAARSTPTSGRTSTTSSWPSTSRSGNGRVIGVGEVQTFRGPVGTSELGMTLIHEHLFVGHPELDLNFPHPEWDEPAVVEAAVGGAGAAVGPRSPHGCRPHRPRASAGTSHVSPRSRAVPGSTWWRRRATTPSTCSLRSSTHTDPGLLVGGPDPLVEYFLRDIEEGMAGTGVRAGMLKVVTDRPGMTPDVRRVMTAAAWRTSRRASRSRPTRRRVAERP